ncbi:MAG: hypothetical protein QM758_03400 [Armatimonas sp.]
MKLNKKRRIALGGLAATVGLATLPVVANAQLEKILTGAAIVVIIDKFGGQINSAFNKIAGDPNRVGGNMTKVVPIVSVGQGGYAGAVQVSGPASAVKQVQAVAQVEGSVRVGTQLRLKALVPVSTKNVSSSAGIKRVYGVGITGLIDARL